MTVDIDEAVRLARALLDIEDDCDGRTDFAAMRDAWTLARAVIALHEELELKRLQLPDDFSPAAVQRRHRAGRLVVDAEQRTAEAIAAWLSREDWAPEVVSAAIRRGDWRKATPPVPRR